MDAYIFFGFTLMTAIPALVLCLIAYLIYKISLFLIDKGILFKGKELNPKLSIFIWIAPILALIILILIFISVANPHPDRYDYLYNPATGEYDRFLSNRGGLGDYVMTGIGVSLFFNTLVFTAIIAALIERKNNKRKSESNSDKQIGEQTDEQIGEHTEKTICESVEERN